MRRLLAYMALLVLPVTLSAQEIDTIPARVMNPRTMPLQITDSLAVQDTARIPLPPRKPDTIIAKTTRQWTLSSDFTTEINTPLDTAFSLFHRRRITDKVSDFNAYPGNYGLPLYQINFFDRDWKPDRYLYSYYYPFMYTPANPLFINTHVPFTEMAWTNAGARQKSEQTFRIRHSQNITRRLNFGLIYDIVYAIGQYDYQQAVDKNFLLHSSYNGDQYTAYFSTGVNDHETYENGGIAGTEFLSQYPPEDVPVMLNDANESQNHLKNRYVLLAQRYSPGGKRDTVTGEMLQAGPVTFSHIGSYEWNKRGFYDKYPGSGFYDTTLISNTSTEDSLYQNLLSNTVRVDFAAGSTGRFRIGAGAGIRNELRNYGQLIPKDTLGVPNEISRHKSSFVLTGKVFNNIGEKFGWSATGDLWFQGYRAGDFIVDGRIFKDFATSRKGMITWDATLAVASYTPSLWYDRWGSNNFSWSLDHAREFRTTAGSSLLWPGRNLSLKFNYAIIDNFIYMGNDATPAQHEGGLSVAALSLRKDLVFWKFHWDNTVLLQTSSNSDVLSLPLVTARSAFFFDHLFKFESTKGELYFQFGAEAMIHTAYYAMNYMPATGRYFSQSDTEIGNYPFINVFVDLKVKRTRIFVMFDHVAAGLIGYNYFLIPDYPMNIRMLRVGFAWTFYD